MSTEKNIKMGLTKSTKNKHVYSSEDDAADIETVYIKKTGLPKEPPVIIELIVKY